MGKGVPVGHGRPGALPGGMLGLLRLPDRALGVAANDQPHRAAPQGVQATDASHGNPARRGRLLSASGFHLAEDGVALASKPCGENV